MLTSIIAQPIDGVFPLAGLQHLEHIVHEKIFHAFSQAIYLHIRAVITCLVLQREF
jgi:hypothetical protein